MMHATILLMGKLRVSADFRQTRSLFDKIRPFGITQVSTNPMQHGFLVLRTIFLFLPTQHPSDVLWHGPQENNDEIAERLGFSTWKPRESLHDFITTAFKCSQHRDCRCRNQSMALSTPWVNMTFGQHNGSERLIDSIIEMRRILDEDELEQLRWTAKITNEAHRSAMQHTRVGGHELDVAAAFHHPIQKAGLGTAYHSIVTVDGEILHNHAYKIH